MFRVAVVLAMCGGVVTAGAQTGRVDTAADYARAESRMNYNADALVYHTVKDPVWLAP